MAAANLTAASGLQSMMPTRFQSGAAKVLCCCPDGRPAHRFMRNETTRISQHRPSATLHRSRRRQIRPLAAADEAITEEAAEAAAEVEAPETEESGAEQQTPVEETPVEETSDASPFAELIQRVRDAISSGSQEDQDQVLAEIDTELTVSSARADAADAQLSAIQGQVDAAQDKYLRLNAEFDNFRKRSAKEKSDAVNKAKGKVIEELLPVIDAFEAAAGQVKAETEGEQRIAGSYQGLYAKMVDAFKKMGLEVVPGVNSPFDPEVHEAIMRAPSEEVPDGTVLQEFRRGFKIGGQLLRPAMVQVSYSEEGTAAEADTLAAQAEHASTEPADAGEEVSEPASSE